MHVPIGPILRSISRRRVAVLSLVLEVAFGLTVVLLSLALTTWFFRQRRDDLTLAGRDLFVVESEGATAEVAGLALEGLPSVARVSWVERAPFSMPRSFDLVSRPGEKHEISWVQRGGPELPETYGLDVVQGAPRVLNPASREPAPVLISEALARRLFGGSAAALGKGIEGQLSRRSLVVTGVFRDILFFSSAAPDSRHAIVALEAGSPRLPRRSHLVRVAAGTGADFPGRASAALARVASWSQVIAVETMREKDDRSWAAGLIIPLVVVFVMLVGALVGTFGMSAYSVTERTRQIGIRRAVGATRADILAHFLVESWLMTSMGLVLGIFTAFAVVRVARRFQGDLVLEWPVVLAGVLVFWATALVAALIPAIQASRIPPVAATRSG